MFGELLELALENFYPGELPPTSWEPSSAKQTETEFQHWIIFPNCQSQKLTNAETGFTRGSTKTEKTAMTMKAVKTKEEIFLSFQKRDVSSPFNNTRR